MRRFIPTCVGNWAVATGSKEACSVHPHMRGELATVTTDAGYDPGSSPHAWGTGISRKHAKIIRRFIPTCVGNWERSFSVHVAVPVHPHMRGELFADAPRVSQSAPRVSRRAWFIPTCVGNCRHRRKSNSESPVHPHMRGELLNSSFNRGSSGGSSPHAWGTVAGRLPLTCSHRFIPTCVGNCSS